MRKNKDEKSMHTSKKASTPKAVPTPADTAGGVEKYFKKYPQKVAWTLKEVYGSPLS